MGTFWMLFFIGLATRFSGNSFVQGRSPPLATADDLYLEETQSGDFPMDDEDDFSSGSGSGLSGVDDDVTSEVEITKTFINKFEALPPHGILPNDPATTPETPYQSSTEGGGQDSPTPTVNEFMFTEQGTEQLDTQTKETAHVTSVPIKAKENRRLYVEGVEDTEEQPKDVTLENLFQRTEVLAAVIAGGVIGFLFALLLILLLVYRMKKKDEGSYALGDRKPPPTAYQKAPTKEFYA